MLEVAVQEYPLPSDLATWRNEATLLWSQPHALFHLEHYLVLDSEGVVVLQIELSGDASEISERIVGAYEWVTAKDDGKDVMPELRAGTYAFPGGDVLYRQTDSGYVVTPNGNSTIQATADKHIRRTFGELWQFNPEEKQEPSDTELLALYNAPFVEGTCDSGFSDYYGEPPAENYKIEPLDSGFMPLLTRGVMAPDAQNIEGPRVGVPGVVGDWFSCLAPASNPVATITNKITMGCWFLAGDDPVSTNGFVLQIARGEVDLLISLTNENFGSDWTFTNTFDHPFEAYRWDGPGWKHRAAVFEYDHGQSKIVCHLYMEGVYYKALELSKSLSSGAFVPAGTEPFYFRAKSVGFGGGFAKPFFYKGALSASEISSLM